MNTTNATARTILDTAKAHHATKAKAIRLLDMLDAEYPAITLLIATNDDGSAIDAFMTVAKDADGETHELSPPARTVPELADLLEACADAGIDPEAGEEAEEEPKASGSVVPENYRATYRLASSNGQTCGDWLAEFLVVETTGANGFHVEDFTHLLALNEISFAGAWARLPDSGQRGWIGRYRMNGRQVLEKQIAWTGHVVDSTGHKVAVPAEALATLRAKHEKWLAKMTKQLERDRADALKDAEIVAA